MFSLPLTQEAEEGQEGFQLNRTKSSAMHNNLKDIV